MGVGGLCNDLHERNKRIHLHLRHDIVIDSYLSIFNLIVVIVIVNVVNVNVVVIVVRHINGITLPTPPRTYTFLGIESLGIYGDRLIRLTSMVETG